MTQAIRSNATVQTDVDHASCSVPSSIHRTDARRMVGRDVPSDAQRLFARRTRKGRGADTPPKCQRRNSLWSAWIDTQWIRRGEAGYKRSGAIAPTESRYVCAVGCAHCDVARRPGNPRKLDALCDHGTSTLSVGLRCSTIRAQLLVATRSGNSARG